MPKRCRAVQLSGIPWYNENDKPETDTQRVEERYGEDGKCGWLWDLPVFGRYPARFSEAKQNSVKKAVKSFAEG